jgi:hypothetical protein
MGRRFSSVTAKRRQLTLSAGVRSRERLSSSRKVTFKVQSIVSMPQRLRTASAKRLPLSKRVPMA